MTLSTNCKCGKPLIVYVGGKRSPLSAWMAKAMNAATIDASINPQQPCPNCGDVTDYEVVYEQLMDRLHAPEGSAGA